MLFNSWPSFFIIGLLLSQTIIFLVTIYFHRACSHRSVILSKSVNKVSRFLSWFLIAMDPQEFAAVHRKHHAKCDTKEDPHSPVNHGWYGVLFGGLLLYKKEVANTETIEKYGKGLPIDSFESFYKKYKNYGILLFGSLLVLLMGWKGLILWTVLMLWIPFWAAGVINGLGHHIGYRNFQTDDLSTNLTPVAFWVGGEELHNNHHAYPASAKFSIKKWEFDIGWGAISILKFFNLASVREESMQRSNVGISEFLNNRHAYLQNFQKAISHHTRDDLKKYGFSKWESFSKKLDKKDSVSFTKKRHIEAVLAVPNIKQALDLELELRRFWKERGFACQEKIQEWKDKASSMGWSKLDEFCKLIPVY